MIRSHETRAEQPIGTSPRRPDSSSDVVVEVRGLTKRFGHVHAVDGIDLRVVRGEFLSLLGPSGCGKTTLLKLIAGFETPTSGRILIAGRDMTALPPNRRPVNMVFQRYALFPHLSVAENIAFGLRLKRLPEDEIRRRVRDGLALVQLEGFERRMPDQLSGGQAQRVALARALVNDPEVLLLDEPLSALDRKIRQQMQEELRRIQAEVGTTFVFVTHDQEEAMAMSTRIALMRAGRIVQVATPTELYWRPASVFAASFVGDANILAGRTLERGERIAVEWHGRVLEGWSPHGGHVGEQVQVVVRPEGIRLALEPPDLDRQSLTGVIRKSTYFGFYWLHRIQVGEAELVVKEFTQVPTAHPGTAVWLTVDPARAVVLPDETSGR